MASRKTAAAAAGDQQGQANFAYKIEALESLQEMRNGAQTSEAQLRAIGKTQDADSVWARVLRLNTEIDILSGQIASDWASGVTTLTAQLQTLRGQLDAGVTQIKADQDTANQVVKVLGLLDQALAIALKFLP